MSASAFDHIDEAGAGEENDPPFVGALLRQCWRRARDRIQEAIRAAGFDDLQEAHLAVFTYPLPDGVRPADLARRMGMSPQATNYLIAQVEALGYLERRASEGSERRLVYMTERGWQVGETIFASLRELQAEWADEVGQKRFADFMAVLRRLAAEEPARDPRK
ncbi:MarR family winged helix-turn-helix transcriptional regulator [Microvirga arsenatis]|uniref:MarR family transcriptional regulator n=1 Tax=Microvirga arsenatis TaxID=2692265 RepID=A0ABW9YYT4_9HYPH|nr:MarR family transcriptional regulator [Microvirga arsenatis]NBJ11271.1 MarR family transcriptional regulator [Microvirga arsenatis]NBJ25544.1 MarR family transcriptional regulator [Microvirga arsenatis]